MAKDLLFEIGMEEVPARFIRGAMEQLRDKMDKWLRESRIEFGDIKAYASPRRITVLVSAVGEKQADVEEQVKGPSKKIALDENGAWSKAALGFARSQGIDPDALFFKELGGVEYVYARKSSLGVETKSLLSESLAQITASMAFPKNMRWGAYELKFVRPIRWIAALFGSETVELDIAGVRSGRVTKGHRFLGGEVELTHPGDYVDSLLKERVFVDVEERRQLILRQIDQLAKEKGWTISIKEDLLEEVLFLVEYPTVLFGSFDPAFLQIPQEVLITSMREHQRYFPVLDQEGNLLPYFVTVRNGNEVSLDVVAKGNEKVLRARLSDAKFFYQEDQKMAIESALTRLETIVFHEELGTIGDKVRRIRKIAEELSKRIGVNNKEVAWIDRTAAICKFDLVTQMVYEFPELQGVMGEDYARKAGEPEQVARGVFEHYQPRFSGDKTPSSIVGSVVSIADKIDTIAGCFSIGIIPTGSQDPYALRRQASGIVQIMLEHRLPCTLSQLFAIAIQVLQKANLLKRDEEEIQKDLFDFFGLRVKNVLSENARYDVVDAVMAGGFDDVFSAVGRGHAMMKALSEANFKLAVESFNRVSNLAAKAGGSHMIDRSLFAEPVEQELYEAWLQVHEEYIVRMDQAQYAESLELLGRLRHPITRFFDSVMVMAEDARVRANRLALLSGISNDLKTYADFQKLVW
jgi:glycyl-tRNA synthetase beta chain